MMPPCSDREAAVLDDVAARLREERFAVDVEEHAARPSPDPMLAGYAALSAVAALFVYPAPLVAALLGGAAVVLHSRDVEGRPLIRQRSCTSHNVIARAPGAPRPDLVIVTQAAVPASRFSEVTLRALVVCLQVGMLAVPVAGGGAWVAEAGTDLPTALRPAGALGAAGIAALAVLLHGLRRAPAANEPAAIDVLVELAPRLRDERVWLAVLGGPATDGIAAFLDGHAEVAGARWLNVIPGDGLYAVSEEGTWRERRADRFLMGASEQAGAEVRPYRAAPTAATVLLARRRRALTLVTGPSSEGLRVALATARAALAGDQP
jgi:hypothetical protein